MSDEKKNQNIKVIGAGGIGTCLLPTLCRYLNYDKRFDFVEVCIIDGDEYEERNKERQHFSRIGNKAEVTVEKLGEEFDRIFLRSQGVYLTEDNIVRIIREDDLIFCCVDNHKTRKLVSDRCKELKNVILISGGNDFSDGNVQIYIREDNKDITVPITEWHPEIANPTDKNPGDTEKQPGCLALAQASPQLVIANNSVASRMLEVFYSLLEGKVDFTEVYFDCLTCSSRKVKREKKLKK